MTILEFVTEKHKGQTRKYTKEPYVNHLVRVASNFEKDSYLYNLALCHDLFEDTDCTEDELKEVYKNHIIKNNIKVLNINGELTYFVWYVNQLTDKFTKEKYTNLNRKSRKLLELKKLSQISSTAMTVKYADLIDNCDIVLYDKSFGKVYLQEKYEILKHCKQGDFDLYYKAIVKHSEMMKLL